jgi:S-DNA-T family DNA segregation ATPase FtsK/SpoIIIE
VDGVTGLIEAVDSAWTGPRAPQVRMLPQVLDGHALPKGFEHPELGVAFGVDEVELAPAFVNFETDPLFIVFGDGESGKSAMLRMLIKQITERYTPEQAGIVVGDFRRALLGTVPPEYLVEYAAAAPAMTNIVEMLRGACSRRLPGPDVTAEQLRNRSWYSGKDMFVIVDDYELVATQSGNPMAPLAEFLPFARDIGLRIIIARSSGGASRSMYEPIMQRMKELGGQGIILSGNKDEGALLGTVKPQPLPPGRGIFVSRRIAAGQMVQTGWLPTQ